MTATLEQSDDYRMRKISKGIAACVALGSSLRVSITEPTDGRAVMAFKFANQLASGAARMISTALGRVSPCLSQGPGGPLWRKRAPHFKGAAWEDIQQCISAAVHKYGIVSCQHDT
jgi:hypothetical protein